MQNFSENSENSAFSRTKRGKKNERIITRLAYQPSPPLLHQPHRLHPQRFFTSKRGIEAAAVPQRKISPVRFIPNGGQADP